jgi:hypothetical protein
MVRKAPEFFLESLDQSDHVEIKIKSKRKIKLASSKSLEEMRPAKKTRVSNNLSIKIPSSKTKILDLFQNIRESGEFGDFAVIESDEEIIVKNTFISLNVLVSYLKSNKIFVPPNSITLL